MDRQPHIPDFTVPVFTPLVSAARPVRNQRFAVFHDVKIRQSAILCALFDTSAALLAMFIVIPAMATTGADLGNGGPGLMFIYQFFGSIFISKMYSL